MNAEARRGCNDSTKATAPGRPVKPVEKVLEGLEGAEKNGAGWKARCPAHDDREPSLSVHEGDDGRVLLRCFAGCETADVAAALGLEMKDLFGRNHDSSGGGGGPYTPPRTTATAQPCNLENYAAAKGLPVEFLERLGLRNMHYTGTPALRIPYRSVEGSEVAVRFRTALTKGENGQDDRFRWRKGSKAMLYGLERLEKIREAGYLILVEGESDTQTLWHHRVPALGIPGASSWRMEWGDHLDGVDRIFAVVEPDQGGAALWERMAASQIREKLYRVELDGFEDVSALHLGDPGRFRERLDAALKDATSYMDIALSEADERRRQAWAVCEGPGGRAGPTGVFRRRSGPLRGCRRVAGSETPLPGRHVEVVAEAGEYRRQGSFVGREVLPYRASAFVLPGERLLRAHGDERARFSLL